MSLWGNWMVAWCCVQESSDIWWYFLSKQNPSVSSPAPQMCLECECINDITVRSDIGPRIIGLHQPADSVKGIPEWGVAMNTSFHFSANPQTTRFLFCPSATLRRYVAYLPHLSAHRPQNLCFLPLLLARLEWHQWGAWWHEALFGSGYLWK